MMCVFALLCPSPFPSVFFPLDVLTWCQVKTRLEDADADLDWIFGNWPSLSFKNSENSAYVTVLSSLNGGQRIPDIGWSAAWVVLSMVLLLSCHCCMPCCLCISCCRRSCISKDEGSPFFGPNEVKREFGVALLNNQKASSGLGWALVFLMVFSNLVGSLGFLLHVATLVYGVTGATYFLQSLPIISIVAYIFGTVLAVYVWVAGHWWWEARIFFALIVFSSFLMTFWFMNLNLIGNTCLD
jgi:hypothetical protein